jgi:hypothetical protein
MSGDPTFERALFRISLGLWAVSALLIVGAVVPWVAGWFRKRI